MVKKEQRRGTRMDMQQLADLVRDRREVDIGEIMLYFDWGHAKAYTMLKAVSGKSYPDIRRLGSSLIYSPDPTLPPSGEEIKISNANSFPVAKKIMEDEN